MRDRLPGRGGPEDSSGSASRDTTDLSIKIDEITYAFSFEPYAKGRYFLVRECEISLGRATPYPLNPKELGVLNDDFRIGRERFQQNHGEGLLLELAHKVDQLSTTAKAFDLIKSAHLSEGERRSLADVTVKVSGKLFVCDARDQPQTDRAVIVARYELDLKREGGEKDTVDMALLLTSTNSLYRDTAPHEETSPEELSTHRTLVLDLINRRLAQLDVELGAEELKFHLSKKPPFFCIPSEVIPANAVVNKGASVPKIVAIDQFSRSWTDVRAMYVLRD